MSEWIPPIRPLRALYARQAINQATPVRRPGWLHVDPQLQTPASPAQMSAAPTPFERHYRRAFPQLDAKVGAKGYLTPQDLDALLWTCGDDMVLVRTLRDYELACRDEDKSYLYQSTTIVVRTVDRGWLGGRTEHDVETPLSEHVRELSHYYTGETSYAAFLEEYVDVFSDWDRQTGSKGHLNRDDIWRLVADPALTSDNAATLATLYEALRGGVPRGETLEFQPQDAIRIGPHEPKAHYLFHHRFLLADIWNQKRKVIAQSSRDVFASTLPDWRAVLQIGFSDCYFEAMLAGLARHDPEAVPRMMARGGTETLSIRFGNGTCVPVTPPTDAELAVHANSGPDGMWATLLHKAWLSSPGSSLQKLTGRPSRRVQGPVDPGLLRSLLRVSESVVVLGMGEGTQFQYYTVCAFDRESDTVTLRNEWGLTPLRGSRETDVSLDKLIETLVCLEADIS